MYNNLQLKNARVQIIQSKLTTFLLLMCAGNHQIRASTLHHHIQYIIIDMSLLSRHQDQQQLKKI
jgi:hypothetical protein